MYLPGSAHCKSCEGFILCIFIFYITGFRVQNFSIEISMHKDNDTQQLLEPELCHKQLEEVPLRTRTVLPCQSETVGRFVRITKVRPNPSRLSLCQVEVYGSRTGKSANNQVIWCISNVR